MTETELQDILKGRIFRSYRIDAAEEASKMNSPKTFNMIVLGGFLKVKAGTDNGECYKRSEKITS